jgi:retron-type reverse transcriptase
MVLNAIYEGDFVGFSYGFRPGRGPHDALDALSTAIKTRKVNWILDADIRNFFGAVSQGWLVRFLEHRIGDKRIIRLIQKWLRAGILEGGVVTVDDRGTGQGQFLQFFSNRREKIQMDYSGRMRTKQLKILSLQTSSEVCRSPRYASLSRLKQGFNSPRERHKFK